MSRSDTIMTTTTSTSDLNRAGTVERDIEQVYWLIHSATIFEISNSCCLYLKGFWIVYRININANKCWITSLASSYYNNSNWQVYQLPYLATYIFFSFLCGFCDRVLLGFRLCTLTACIICDVLLLRSQILVLA